MLVIALFCIVVGFASSQPWSQDSCGERPLVPDDDADKILGGTVSVRGDWPWSCSMRYGAGKSHICGGSLINGQWILTAAHCADSGYPASSYVWHCGLHNRQSHDPWSREFPTKRYVVHPQYNSRVIQNDIALFKISDTDITFDNYVMPVCIPDATESFGGKNGVAMGWGTTSSGGSLATQHMEVVLKILHDADCVKEFGANSVNPASQVCAGERGDGKDTCQGDSGGPLVAKSANNNKWGLVGATSWGFGCGDIGVYTDVPSFRPWILQHVLTLPSGASK